MVSFEHLIIEEFRQADTQPIAGLLNQVYRGYVATLVHEAVYQWRTWRRRFGQAHQGA
jgi:hypothetical protein